LEKNRLLPEQYCDFLLALYTEGNGLQEKTVKLISRKSNLTFLLFMLIHLGIFFFYFTELSLILQMVFSLVLIFSGVYLSFYFTRKGLLFQIPLIISALLLLFVSVEMVLTYFPENMILLYGILMFNCLLWLVGGWRLKQIYFTISGMLGLLLIIFSMFK
jgi:hypothetical protein